MEENLFLQVIFNANLVFPLPAEPLILQNLLLLFKKSFNSFSKEEQALYNKAHISRDIRNQCFIWTAIMLAGALLSYVLTPYMAIPSYVIWLVLFFKEVHFDNHKAFEKYLLK